MNIEDITQSTNLSQGTKLPYESPQLDVYDYVVERGFATSPMDRIASSETVSEIQDESFGSNGENYHGEWF